MHDHSRAGGGGLKPRVHLTHFCLLEKDSQHAKFQFRLNNYSEVHDHCISRVFNFGGHLWKLQVSKKHGCFGMFLRWYGTTRNAVAETANALNLACSVSTIFAVVNAFFPRTSIIEGNRNEVDIFKRVSSGIGFGKMAELDDLEGASGYILSDCVYLQLQLKIHNTTFFDKLLCLPTEENGATLGKEFWFYGTTWRLLFFPHGEKNSTRVTEDTEEDDEKFSSIYLQRCGENSVGLLRHNVRYRLSVEEIKDIVLDQHFYHRESNAYGTATFLPVSTIDSMSTIEVSVTIEHVVPYTYFAYERENIEARNNEDSFSFVDQFNYPWSFQLSVDSKSFIKGSLTLDPKNKNKEIASLTTKGKFLQVCWLAELLSPVDIDKSVLFKTKSERQVNDTVFHADTKMDSIVFPIKASQLSSDESPLKDIDGYLCIRLSVYSCNYVTSAAGKMHLSLNLDDVGKICNDIRRSITPPPPQIIEIQADPSPSPPPQPLPEPQSPIRENDSLDGNHRDALIQSLVDHLDSSHEYIKRLEKNPLKAKTIHGTTSIASLIQTCRPCDHDYKHLALLAKTLENIFHALPVELEKVLHSGAFGQGTVVNNHLVLDFVIYIKEFRRYKRHLKLLLNVIVEKIKVDASKDVTDKQLNRSDSRYQLPYVSNFYTSSNFVLFKSGDVNVSVLLSQAFEDFKSPGEVYKKASKAKHASLHNYIAMMSYLQVQCVDMQTFRCKELICVVKSWSNDVIWKNAETRPGSYLLTLLVIDAYHTVESLCISKTPSFDREVLDQFGRSVKNKGLRIEWNLYYNPDNYDLDEPHNQPVVRDPAIPYHNVAKTGLKDWTQLRHEVDYWIESITF